MEQDLIISRALCDLFSHQQLRGKIAFRGGTAINKLLFSKPLRYSEDIDLVQTVATSTIGPTVDAIRDALSWLGDCKRSQAQHSMHLAFKFSPEVGGGQLKLKVEINTREQKNLYGLKTYPFRIDSDWCKARADISSFEPEELFGTKLRALLQRNKNRDLFDLNEGLKQLDLDCDRVLACFHHYLALENSQISRANAEERMLKKLNQSLIEDIAPLLPSGVPFTENDAIVAFGTIWKHLIQRIPGDPWKSTDSVIAAIRKDKIPELLLGVHE